MRRRPSAVGESLRALRVEGIQPPSTKPSSAPRTPRRICSRATPSSSRSRVSSIPRERARAALIVGGAPGQPRRRLLGSYECRQYACAGDAVAQALRLCPRPLRPRAARRVGEKSREIAAVSADSPRRRTGEHRRVVPRPRGDRSALRESRWPPPRSASDVRRGGDRAAVSIGGGTTRVVAKARRRAGEAAQGTHSAHGEGPAVDDGRGSGAYVVPARRRSFMTRFELREIPLVAQAPGAAGARGAAHRARRVAHDVASLDTDRRGANRRWLFDRVRGIDPTTVDRARGKSRGRERPSTVTSTRERDRARAAAARRRVSATPRRRSDRAHRNREGARPISRRAEAARCRTWTRSALSPRRRGAACAACAAPAGGSPTARTFPLAARRGGHAGVRRNICRCSTAGGRRRRRRRRATGSCRGSWTGSARSSGEARSCRARYSATDAQFHLVPVLRS